jgi:HEAT repeat protein
MPKALTDVVDEILHIVRTSPPHVYWHGLDQRRALFARPDDAIPLLAPALGDPDPQVRRYVARVVRELDRRTARRVLLPLLSDPDDDVRLEAAGAVLEQPGWHGRDPPTPTPALDPGTRAALAAALAPLLSSRKLYVRDRAIELLEMFGSFEHVALLVARLPEPDWNHRSLVFRAIARSPDCVAILGPLVDHPDAETRAAACLTLSNVEAVVPGSALAKLVVAHLNDAEESVRFAVALCIGRRALVEAEDELIHLLSAPAKAESKHGLITALGLLKSERSIPLLVAELRPDSAIRDHAIKALGQMRPRPDIEEALVRVLTDDPDLYMRNNAAGALADVGTVLCVPALERFLAKDARRMSKRLRKDALRTLPLAIERLRAKP